MNTIFLLAVLLVTATPVFAQNETGVATVSGKELDDILTVLVATNSPLINLAGNLRSELQVSLPPATSPVRLQIGNTSLLPIDKTRAGLILAVKLESRTDNQITVRADVNYFDPYRGYANDGAEWKLLVFQLVERHWTLTKDLGGAIR